MGNQRFVLILEQKKKIDRICEEARGERGGVSSGDQSKDNEREKRRTIGPLAPFCVDLHKPLCLDKQRQGLC